MTNAEWGGGWNHRVMRATHAMPPYEDEVAYGIHEVYYDDEGNPKSHTAYPVGMRADTYRELAEEWIRVQRAFELPVLEFVDGEYRELEVRV